MRALLLLVVVAGCYTTTHVRYVHLPEPPDQARADLEDKRSSSTRVHVEAEGAGSFVEVTGSELANVDAVAPGGETYSSLDEPGLDLDGIYNDLVVDAGLGFAPHHDGLWWRIDAMAHAGTWLFESEVQRYLAPRTRVALVGGLGAAFDTAAAFRPEVGIRVERQDAIARIDGRTALAGRRKAFTLSFSTPVNGDHYTLEGSALVEIQPYGGVFARVGREHVNADDRTGTSFLAGYRVDSSITYGTIKGVLALAAAGVLACVMATSDYGAL